MTIRWWHRVLGAAAAGALMYAAFPPRDLWLLTPLALAVLYAVLTVGRPSVRSAAGSGFVFGLAFFVPLLPWIGEYVGPLPWLALATVMAAYLAAFGALAAVLMRRWRLRPLWFAAAWVTIEAVRSAFPFGGFPWGRAAFSQTSGWFLPLASVIGVPGLSFVLALVGAAAATLVVRMVDAPRGLRTAGVLSALAALIVPPVVGVALGGAGNPLTTRTGSIDVAAVQGNVPRLGLDFNAQRRAVLDNHVRETRRLGARVDEGRAPRPDLVLWPENAADSSPAVDPEAAVAIRSAVSAVGAPLAFGTWMRDDGRLYNSTLLWSEHDGIADEAPSGRYDKHIIQPFGEYLPWRDFFRLFSSYADRAGDFVPGSGPSVLTADTRHGEVVAGVATCWEIAFDRAPHASIRDGAQFLYVPTNNATFGRTEMTYQQLAMSQVRAVETGRSVVVAATSGVSAVIAPDGTLMRESGFFEPAVLESTIDLRSGETLAVRLGPWPERAVVAATGAAFLVVLAGAISLDVFAGRRRPAAEKEHDDQQPA
ncbi:apolipoprotein N-acyltransferase [Gordonia shandongensis]|uniref:apolipoprotein N-acyltransferase n=1 Tax=Gordonia shandongensis TaxID=376351 RepID=UPI0004275F04|nr:apolipoprotein N-acyltransferase [Gordonia shandongensis]